MVPQIGTQCQGVAVLVALVVAVEVVHGGSMVWYRNDHAAILRQFIQCAFLRDNSFSVRF